MATPSTRKTTHNGHPCLHLSDEAGDEFQVHTKADDPMSLVVSVSTDTQVTWRGVPVPGVAVAVYLTRDQAHALAGHLRAFL